MRIVGLDPGFAKFGFAVLEIDSSNRERLVAAGVIETRKSPKKSRTFAADDNVRRMQEIAEELRELFTPETVLICSEAQSWGMPNASTAIKVGFTWGILIALAGDIPIRQVSPQLLKEKTAGSRGASKTEVEDAVRERWKEIDALLEELAHGKRNHAFDAAGALLACLDSEIVRALRIANR